MKICKECHEVKPLEDFHKNPCMRDGHINICKPCKNAQIKAYKRNGRPEVGTPGMRSQDVHAAYRRAGWC